MTRGDRILALMWTVLDLDPAASVSSYDQRRGLAPSERVPCESCGGVLVRDDFGKVIFRHNGQGFFLDRFKRPEPCETCGGKRGDDGQVIAGNGWVERDRMDSERAPLRTGDAHAKPTKPPPTRRCDACDGTGKGGMHLDPQGRPYRGRCDYCAGSGRRETVLFVREREPRDADVDTRLDDELAALERQRKAGSYDELIAALSLLATRHRRCFDVLYQALVAGGRKPEAGSWTGKLMLLGLAFIDSRMPPQIRVPADVQYAWKQRQQRGTLTLANGRGAGKVQLDKRDKEIRKLVRQGRPTQWVAGEYALSVASVNRIVNGEETAA